MPAVQWYSTAPLLLAMSVSSVPNAAWAVGLVTKSCSISSIYCSAEAGLVSVG
jgi:hypothetical protein